MHKEITEYTEKLLMEAIGLWILRKNNSLTIYKNI